MRLIIELATQRHRHRHTGGYGSPKQAVHLHARVAQEESMCDGYGRIWSSRNVAICIYVVGPTCVSGIVPADSLTPPSRAAAAMIGCQPRLCYYVRHVLSTAALKI